MEHPKRSLIKALTWRFFGFIVTTIIVFVYSGDVRESLTVGVVVEGMKLALYYIHERLWNRLEFGRQKVPEYQI